MKRRQESEPALISVIFISAPSERSEIPLVEKRERQENCQSINLLHTATHYLNYPDLLPYWPRSSVGRASEDLTRRSWVQTPSNFL